MARGLFPSMTVSPQVTLLHLSGSILLAYDFPNDEAFPTHVLNSHAILYNAELLENYKLLY